MLLMSNSTKKAIRTLAQGLLAFALVIPVLVPALDLQGDMEAVGLLLVGAAAAITKGWNALEDAGVLPEWLKLDVPAE